MQKRVLTMISLVVLLLTMSVQAIDLRVISAKPQLSFSGTTAQCNAVCRGESSKDKIEGTLTLYQGDTYVDSWSNSGTGSITISGNCRAKSGKSYKLVLTYSVNGKAQSSVTVTKTCP